MYNNEQLKSAQQSGLGVDIGSSTVSAIGQADDVILAANSLDSLKFLARLTEVYCDSFRVKLVASKTKLLPVYLPRHSFLVDYAKVTNSVKIENTTVSFVHEAEHVGVLRSTHGNMPNILQRIASHKKALGGVSSAGMARSHRGNPAASLRVHQLYATPVLLSGLGSLYLNEAEQKVLDAHYQNTIQNIQRLHQNTPRGVVFLLAGCLPGKAMLHSRQLSLLLMVCHLPEDPLNKHAKHILSCAPPSAKSWFQQVRMICKQYGLPNPLQLLDKPPNKEHFKSEVKSKIVEYWHELFTAETRKLKSLKYFKPELYSLMKPHYMWSTAASNPFECSKSSALAKMASGRFRTDMLCRYWSHNRSGSCRSPSCHETPGTLEHILVSCPSLASTRERLYQMWLDKSVMFPALHSTIREVLSSTPETIVQFVLEPLAFSLILADVRTHGDHYIQQLSYMTRTFAFYMQREYKRLQKTYNEEFPIINNTIIISGWTATTPGNTSPPAVGPPSTSPQCSISTRCTALSCLSATSSDLSHGDLSKHIPLHSGDNTLPHQHDMSGLSAHQRSDPLVFQQAVQYHHEQSDHHEPVEHDPHGRLGLGRCGGGGVVAGRQGDSKHGPSHNHSQPIPPRSLELSHHHHS